MKEYIASIYALCLKCKPLVTNWTNENWVAIVIKVKRKKCAKWTSDNRYRYMMKKKYYDMGLRMQLCNTYGAKIKLSFVFYYIAIASGIWILKLATNNWQNLRGYHIMVMVMNKHNVLLTNPFHRWVLNEREKAEQLEKMLFLDNSIKFIALKIRKAKGQA